MKIGLKLWSTNDNYFSEALSLYKHGYFSYIELYCVPDSFDKFSGLWRKLDIPFVIHAPHFMQGLNLADKDKEKSNFQLINEAKQFANILNAKYIIVHPGIGGEINETCRQLKMIYDERFLVENKPYYIENMQLTGNAATKQELKYIFGQGFQFCLDIGHAICAANALGYEPITYIKLILSSKPKMFHLTDGEFSGTFDRHYHLGHGNFPLKQILALLDPDLEITLETIKDSKENLNDFINDVKYLKQL
jgi:endonuclease IV